MENEELTKDFWMERLGKLLSDPELKTGVIAKMEKVDEYFSTRSGQNDFNNVKRNKGSVMKTALVVKTLEKYLEVIKPCQPVSKTLRRQKISL